MEHLFILAGVLVGLVIGLYLQKLPRAQQKDEKGEGKTHHDLRALAEEGKGIKLFHNFRMFRQ